MWDYAPVQSREDGDSNLGRGIFILLERDDWKNEEMGRLKKGDKIERQQ